MRIQGRTLDGKSNNEDDIVPFDIEKVRGNTK